MLTLLKSSDLAALNERKLKMGEEKYTIEQIIDAITQADEEIIQAVCCKDREGLEDILKDYLKADFAGRGKGE